MILVAAAFILGMLYVMGLLASYLSLASRYDEVVARWDADVNYLVDLYANGEFTFPNGDTWITARKLDALTVEPTFPQS